MTEEKRLKVLEFYSGIGGFHYALSKVRPNAQVVRAFDINDIANKVYRHNFPSTKVHQKLIESIKRDRFASSLQADMYHMSPPCQPYTRTGNMKGIKDSRSSSFSYVLDIIETLEHPPKYLLVENVKGFESSNAREPLMKMLQHVGYTFQEFILSPDQFGIPNSRLRYFLVAVLSPLQLPSKPTGGVIYHIPTMKGQFNGDYSEETCLDSFLPPYPQQTPGVPPIRPWVHCPTQPVSNFIAPLTNDRELKMTLVPMKLVCKRGQVLDIVDETSKRTMCFTKAYSHFAEGTGSVILANPSYNLESCAKLFAEHKQMIHDFKLKQEKQMHQDKPVTTTENKIATSSSTTTTTSTSATSPASTCNPFKKTKDVQVHASKLQQLHAFEDCPLKELKIRWFSVRELLTLHGFGSDYTQPHDVSDKQMRKCIGNGLNTLVVQHLLNYMFQSK
eukprot:m.48569 g.48569  ORF g.48569 m.48569 type:complete len:446 (-) comp10843_c0_seq2:124-1461(-)